MLYEMATGVRPFKGDTGLSTLTAIMRDTPKPVTELNPAIPKERGRVIRRAMAKDPDRRQQTGKDLRNELDEMRVDCRCQRIDYDGPRQSLFDKRAVDCVHCDGRTPATSRRGCGAAIVVGIRCGRSQAMAAA